MGAYSVLEIPECSKLNKFLCHPPAILSAMKELTPKQVLAVRCPTCGAPPGVRCELGIGRHRTEPHRGRETVSMEN